MKTKFERLYRHLMHDSMRRNSIMLILSQAVLAGSLFLFFIISAHLFPASTVGLASAFISYGLLVATFTNLGLPNTIIRFLPRSQRKAGLFTAALSLVTIWSLLGGIIALALLSRLVPKLSVVSHSAFLGVALVLLISGTAVSVLLDGTMVAFRKAEYVFGRSLITNIPRIILPFFFVAAGLKGMTGIFVAGLLLGLIFNVVMIFRRLVRGESKRPTLGEITAHRTYAASNYFGGMFGVLPSTVVPLIVLQKLGPAAAAYYYMPAQIAAFLSVVCNSISQAFISEASQTEDPKAHKQSFHKALRHQYQVLVPIIIALAILGWPILRIYGKAYVHNGYEPLLILLFSALIVGVNWLGDTWLNVKKRARAYFLMNAFNALVVVGSVLVFAKHGLVAAALGWLVGQTISALVYLGIFGRSHLLELG